MFCLKCQTTKIVGGLQEERGLKKSLFVPTLNWLCEVCCLYECVCLRVFVSVNASGLNSAMWFTENRGESWTRNHVETEMTSHYVNKRNDMVGETLIHFPHPLWPHMMFERAAVAKCFLFWLKNSISDFHVSTNVFVKKHWHEINRNVME